MEEGHTSIKKMQSHKEPDLVIIGGGSAAFAGALKGIELGASITMINDGLIGGTCINVGCVPSKTLIRAAEAHHRAQHSFHGIESQSKIVDFKSVIAQKDRLVEKLRQKKYVDVLNGHSEIEWITGKGTFVDGNTVEVGERKIRAKKVLIATGSAPYIPPVPGLAEAGIMTSTDAFAMTELPEKLIVLGGRYIALEIAQMFSRLGTQVIILQRSTRILPDEAPELTEALTAYLSDEGITIKTNVSLKSARREGKEVVLYTEVDGIEQTFLSPYVVAATGRTANINHLGLGTVGVKTAQNGAIAVDNTLESSVPGIYGAGDVIGAPQFVYTAAYEGALAVENALTDKPKKRDYSALPWVIFTDPQVAGVGLNAQQASDAGIDAHVVTLPMEQVPRALAARDTRGLITLVRDRSTDQLVGGRILAPEGSELSMEISLAIKYGITTAELANIFHPYLTNAEAIKLAAVTFRKNVDQLSCCAA